MKKIFGNLFGNQENLVTKLFFERYQLLFLVIYIVFQATRNYFFLDIFLCIHIFLFLSVYNCFLIFFSNLVINLVISLLTIEKYIENS